MIVCIYWLEQEKPLTMDCMDAYTGMNKKDLFE